MLLRPFGLRTPALELSGSRQSLSRRGRSVHRATGGGGVWWLVAAQLRSYAATARTWSRTHFTYSGSPWDSEMLGEKPNLSPIRLISARLSRTSPGRFGA